MPLPTVESLTESLGDALAPAPGFVPPPLDISAVHVSELLDPTDYLVGGELLLTTGLSLPDSSIGCDRYVSRLRRAGLSALGIGLGPSLQNVPAALSAACAKHKICLLVVPPEAAFLTVTKAYWIARSRSSQRELTDALTAHRSLVDAMVSRNPVGETLKALSRAVGAWVARLDTDGTVEHVFPTARVRDAIAVTDHIPALRDAGVHSSATYPSGEEVVAVFPLPLEDRVVGYIAIGSAEPLGPTARRLVLTAGALLSLDSVQRRRADAARQAQMEAVSVLLDLGLAEPARRLASRTGVQMPGEAVRVLVVRSARPADATEGVLSHLPGAMPGPAEQDRLWFVVPGSHPGIDRLERSLLRADPKASAILSGMVSVPAIHLVRIGLLERLARAPSGSVSVPLESGASGEQVAAGVQRVLAYSRADLTSTLVSYLRHRGQWDAAAREIGVHRNTVRHRLQTIRQLLGCDLDDPDVSAVMWLHLRENGLT